MSIKVLDIQSFKELVFDFENNQNWLFRGKKPTIIDFYADWCGPCHMLTPILEDIALQYAGKVDFFKINTEQTPELSALFEVRSIPTLLFITLDNQEPVLTSGVLPRETFVRAIKEIFNIDP